MVLIHIHTILYVSASAIRISVSADARWRICVRAVRERHRLGLPTERPRARPACRLDDDFKISNRTRHATIFPPQIWHYSFRPARVAVCAGAETLLHDLAALHARAGVFHDIHGEAARITSPRCASACTTGPARR